MSNRIASFVAIATLGASAGALAQAPEPHQPPTPTDLTFTTTGTHCEDVKWAPQTLARYPHIVAACQRVVQRDGKYFVVFSGTVHSVAGYGRTLSVDFENGDEVTLKPPTGMKFDIGGTMTRPRDILPGQNLTFYVPQDRFVAEVPEGEHVMVPIPITQWEPQRIAYAAPATIAPRPAELPQTGTELGLLALGGLVLMVTGAGITTARYRRDVP
jgi:LPXTG-motif cell wall-anchored protein